MIRYVWYEVEDNPNIKAAAAMVSGHACNSEGMQCPELQSYVVSRMYISYVNARATFYTFNRLLWLVGTDSSNHYIIVRPMTHSYLP